MPGITYEASAAGDAETADRLWKRVAEEVETSLRQSLPALDAQIANQQQAYRDRKMWYRDCAETPPRAPEGSPVHPVPQRRSPWETAR